MNDDDLVECDAVVAKTMQPRSPQPNNTIIVAQTFHGLSLGPLNKHVVSTYHSFARADANSM
jgi:hypothetical protein